MDFVSVSAENLRRGDTIQMHGGASVEVQSVTHIEGPHLRIAVQTVHGSVLRYEPGTPVMLSGRAAAVAEQCRGFVPKHGYGQAHDCGRCGRHLAEHPVRAQ